MAEERRHFFDEPRNVGRVLRALYVACAAALLADFAVHRHARFPGEGLWGFYGIYGFVACVILVLVAKELRKVLMRDPDYYDPEKHRSDAGGGGGAPVNHDGS